MCFRDFDVFNGNINCIIDDTRYCRFVGSLSEVELILCSFAQIQPLYYPAWFHTFFEFLDYFQLLADSRGAIYIYESERKKGSECKEERYTSLLF